MGQTTRAESSRPGGWRPAHDAKDVSRKCRRGAARHGGTAGLGARPEVDQCPDFDCDRGRRHAHRASGSGVDAAKYRRQRTEDHPARGPLFTLGAARRKWANCCASSSTCRRMMWARASRWCRSATNGQARAGRSRLHQNSAALLQFSRHVFNDDDQYSSWFLKKPWSAPRATGRRLISAPRPAACFLLTLDITNIIEQEALDVSIYRLGRRCGLGGESR